MKRSLTAIKPQNCLSIFLLLSLTTLSTPQQFIDTPIILYDDTPLQLKTLTISTELSDLPITQQIHQNKYIDKQIEITTRQTFTYSSTVLSPIFVLEKQWCHTHEGTVEISRLEDIYYHDSFGIGNKEGNSVQNKDSSLIADPLSLSQQHQWVYNKKYNILYKISSSLKIDAYKLKHQSLAKKMQSLKDNNQIINILDQQKPSNQKYITHIASLQLLKNQQQKQKFFTQCSQQADVLPILNKNSQKLYVFTCNAVYMVECQAVLAKWQKLFEFGATSGNNNSNREMGKVFMGIEVKTVNEYIFWLSQVQGIRIYGIALDGRLEYVQTLKVPEHQQSQKNHNYKNKNFPTTKQPPKLSSLEYINGMLYVLTLNQGVYIYQRMSAYHFELQGYLEYLPQFNKVNKEIIVIEGTMVIWSQSKKWQFVAQINVKQKRKFTNQQYITFNKQLKSSSNNFLYSLNRYFKGYKSISSIKLLNQKSLNKIQNLLLIVSQRGVQLYPLSKDPRQTSLVMNGVVNSHMGRDIREIYEVGDGIFVFEAFRETLMEEKNNSQSDMNKDKQTLFGLESSVVQTYLVVMSMRYPAIECKFQQQGVYTLYVEQQMTEIQPTSSSVKQNTPLKQQSSPPITPSLHYQPHFYHRLSIRVKHQLSIEYLTLLVSILSISFLIAIIALLIYWRQNKLSLIDKLVLQIRKLHKQKPSSVEFEQSSPQKTVEMKWDELREEIQDQISYKIENNDNEGGFDDNNMESERNFIKSSGNQSQEEPHKYEAILPSKNTNPSELSNEIQSPPRALNAIQNNPKFVDPVINEVSPLGQNKQQNINSSQDESKEIQVTDSFGKSLKSDMRISRQDIFIQSSSVNKKYKAFEQEMQENQLEELNFGTNLSEQLGEKQVNLSIIDDDSSHRDKDHLLNNYLQHEQDNIQSEE